MGCTKKLNILTTIRSVHTVFVCFVFVLLTFKKLIGFYNRDEKLQRRTDWVFK
jgi:hypothetical protein